MGNGSIGNRHVVQGRHRAAVFAAHSPDRGQVDVRWDRVLRVRVLLAQGAYRVSSACLADAILRRIPAAV